MRSGGERVGGDADLLVEGPPFLQAATSPGSIAREASEMSSIRARNKPPSQRAIPEIVEPFAGESTKVDVNLVVSIAIALSLVLNGLQFVKGRSRRDELSG